MLTLTLTLACLVALAPGTDPPPNIVVILADDLGIGDVRCYNADSRILTPTLDALASQGMQFTDAHSPSAVCSPTRYGLLTGRYAWRTRLKSGVLWTGYARPLIADEPTIASLLADAGYATGCIGKWHLGLEWVGDDDRPVTSTEHHHIKWERAARRGAHTVGFDYSLLVPASLDMPPYCWVENGRVREAPTIDDPGSKRIWSGGDGFWRAGLRSPDFEFHDVASTIARTAVRFVRKHAPQESPYFLYVPFASPHTPWVPRKPGGSKVGTYGDFVSELDALIGHILRAIETSGDADNTIVVVTSDNGAHWPRAQIERWRHRSNGALRGQKADIHEGGHRIPLLVRWPGTIEPGSTSSHLACLTDLLATCTDIAGIERGSAGEDSVSLLPVLRGEADAPTRTFVVHHSLDGTFAIRRGDWKLILGAGSGGFTAPKTVANADPPGQLFNLASDPSEQRNVYAEHPDIVAELTAALDTIRTGARTP